MSEASPCVPVLAVPAFLESARGFELVGLLFWLWMLYLCATREPASARKILWLVVIVVTPPFGALFYFFSKVLQPRR